METLLPLLYGTLIPLHHFLDLRLAPVQFEKLYKTANFVGIICLQVFIARNMYVFLAVPSVPDAHIIHDEVQTLLEIRQIGEGVWAALFQSALTVFKCRQHGVTRVTINVRDTEKAKALQEPGGRSRPGMCLDHERISQ